MDALRRQAHRRARSLEAAVATGEDPPDPGAGPAELFEQAWRRELVWAALDRLRDQVSEMDYRIFYLRAMRERPVAEVAALEGMTAAKVCTHHYRVARKFEVILQFLQGAQFGEDEGDEQ